MEFSLAMKIHRFPTSLRKSGNVMERKLEVQKEDMCFFSMNIHEDTFRRKYLYKLGYFSFNQNDTTKYREIRTFLA